MTLAARTQSAFVPMAGYTQAGIFFARSCGERFPASFLREHQYTAHGVPMPVTAQTNEGRV